jgi:hypothetical protein
MIWGRKTYTLNFRTIKKRCSYGVVAKPGIATGSRSNNRALLENETRGSRVQMSSKNAAEYIPSAPFWFITNSFTQSYYDKKPPLIQDQNFFRFDSIANWIQSF